ncbi:MAG: hypothetical protein JNJ54_03115 [Myxococcaceae bacterium]|nr:hypothetical protein [Myxococcaceae bacterium]
MCPSPAHSRRAAALLAAAVAACAGSGEGLDRDGRPLRIDAGAADAGVEVDGGDGDGGAGPDAGADAGVDAGVVDERVRFGWIQKNIFTQTCAAYCHRGAAAPKSLQLDAVNGYQRIVGVKSTEVPTLELVKPGDPMNSYLYVKVIPADPRRVGERMPLNEPPYLSTEKIEAIRGWISRGAPRD